MINLIKNLKICSSSYCPHTGKWQFKSNFSKDNKGKYKLFAKCKDCNKIYRESRINDLKKYQKEYYLKNQNKIKNRSKLRRKTNEKEIKNWLKQNSKKIQLVARIYRNKRRQEDVSFRLAENLRTRLYMAIKDNQKGGSAIADLGCSIDNLKIWLERQFYSHPKTGEQMTWQNYGKKWHIDHVIPLSKVDLTNPIELKKVCHWFNLRSLWAEQNISRGNKI